MFPGRGGVDGSDMIGLEGVDLFFLGVRKETNVEAAPDFCLGLDWDGVCGGRVEAEPGVLGVSFPTSRARDRASVRFSEKRRP